jgi:hypothetical protein
MISSGATDQGTAGVELWLAKELGIQESTLFILYSDSRLLLVVARLFDVQTYFCVGHALDSGYAEDERLLWWQRTARVISKFRAPAAPLIVMIDANARV